MKIDHDIIQRGKVGLIFILQFYRITTGTMLSLFVPQSCGDHVCTLRENYEKEDNYHKIAIYMNGFSMFVFFLFYIIELIREEWCVKYLDINNNKSDNNLRHIIEKYPKLNTQMDKINKIYYKLFIFNSIVYFANICVTIKVLNDYYYNSATLSCFTSFVLLVLMKLYSSFIVSYYSIKDDKMSSAYVNEFVSYNVMDSDFLETQKNKIKEIKDENILEDIIPIVN
tara:strand:- start:524 stop:1201 length:678 start_codon:yes stop_codon:yes gene_type:complete